MKAKKFILNIGLNNNPKGTFAIADLVKERLADRLTWGKVDSTYLDQQEPTIVLHGETLKAFKDIIDTIKQLSADLDQECIGAEIDGQGLLIYPDQFTGERYKFDYKYFKKIIA
jgi:hypothetical protein